MDIAPSPAAFTRIELPELTSEQLQPGCHIVGFRDWRDFNTFEAHIGTQLVHTIASRTIEIPKDALMRQPLGDVLRPQGFNGRITDTDVFVTAYDKHSVARYPGMAGRKPADTGLTVMVAADLRSSKGPVGTLFREVSYYATADTRTYVRREGISTLKGASRCLQRALGTRHNVQPIESVIAAMRQDSSENARQLIMLGLHRIYSAGLPSLGKKT